MQVGLTLPNRGVLFGVTTPDQMLQMAEIADRSGLFQSVWVGDSLLGKPRMEAIALLAGVAARTKRVRLGPACMASFPLRDPVLLAYQWASLDLLAGGRTVLVGLHRHRPAGGRPGRGAPLRGHEQGPRGPARGVDHHPEAPLDRGSRHLRGRALPLHGHHHRAEAGGQAAPADLDREQQRSAAARSSSGRTGASSSTPRAGRPRSRTRTTSAGASRTSAEDRRGRTRPERDRDPPLPQHQPQRGPGRRLEESKRFLDVYYAMDFPPSRVRSWTAAGSADQCVEHLRVYEEMGFHEVTLRIAGWDQLGQLERVMREVLPRLLR